MTARCVTVLLTVPPWTPPGVPAARWRHALAEDVVDLLSVLDDIDVAIAAAAEGVALAEAIRWPGMPVYRMPGPARPVAALAAAAADGYDQALVLAPDLPDLPALLIGKLFRPLTSRSVAAAPVLPDRPGMVGLASRLPVPEWLVDADPDLSRTGVDELRAAAGQRARVAVAPGWHRLRGPDDLGLLDVALDGWDATRLLLGGGDQSWA